ncbi:SOS response-associated peptidase [Sinorhizobium meliloti]|nr:SOS response-associated peptidase [Sinorhizobium meliloti]MDW9911555.1 SOS response-associated peptidase [Sinorhizobium meliloti]MDW9973745.1 SOS response-associated peptidase [Sinorhizobium meliloti]MDW9978341.1 SOS response-associated peptidase [Sinorhizobium meliloti]MDX0296015.1 SOS response-associated peptidase [Sinorhizobium meliloti]
MWGCCSCYVLTMTSATVFQPDAPLDERRVIIRRHDGDVEMVELPWGLRPRDGDARAVNVVRSKGRTFPTHRCLVPASEFRHRTFGFSLANGDWFYFAGIWRPAINDWPESYAILTIEANDDLAPFHDRQMVVLRREQRMAWFDGLVPEGEILRRLPAGTFRVTRHSTSPVQPMLAV